MTTASIKLTIDLLYHMTIYMYVPYDLNPSVSEMEILTAKKYKT